MGEGTHIEVLPMAGCIGAEISGVDLRAPLSAAAVREIRQALLTWKVVFFRSQELSQEEHIAFSASFGEIAPPHPTLPAAFPDHPEILLLDNEVFTREETEKIESRWHTDVTFSVAPPMASVLRGVVVPPYGGDTQWTNLVAAYEALSPPLQDLLCNLHAVHVNASHVRRGESATLAQQFQSRGLAAVHPVVRVHPETGERAIFVNPTFTSHIVELTRQEGRHLLEMIYEHMTDARFTVRFRWEPGSIAFWDNRATAHLVPTDIPPGARRSMQRLTLVGDVPVGVHGSRSERLEVAA